MTMKINPLEYMIGVGDPLPSALPHERTPIQVIDHDDVGEPAWRSRIQSNNGSDGITEEPANPPAETVHSDGD